MTTLAPQELKHFHQRFENFSKAFQQLEKAVSIETLSEIERSGLIKIFEFSFELAWKCLKDYLKTSGLEKRLPREVIKESFQAELIQDGHIWIEALEKRNLLSHCYDESLALEAEELIKKQFYPILQNFYEKFSKK